MAGLSHPVCLSGIVLDGKNRVETLEKIALDR
jgi:hypothetical protein